MSPRSKVLTLPKAVKAWLDAALTDGNFSGYEQLSAELKKRGHAISKSALQRYGSPFEESLARLKLASEQAKAVVSASPDDDDDMSQALVRLTQKHLLDVMQALDEAQVAIDPTKVNIEKLMLAIARVSRVSLPLKKWKLEQRAKVTKVADAVTATAKKAGMSDELVNTIRRDILGIADGAAPAPQA